MRRASTLGIFAVVLASSSAFAQARPPAKKPAKKPPAEPTLSAVPAAQGAPAATPLPPAPQPPPPPPWTAPSPAPTSTSGESLMPAGASSTASIAAPSAAPAMDWAQIKLTDDNRFQMIEARLAADEKQDVENAEHLSWLKGFRLSGFVQPQILIQSYDGAASPNLNATGALPAGVTANDVIARSNGSTSNGTFFRLRRARLKTEYAPVDSARLVFEIDPTPAGGATGGIGTIARTVEAQGIAHWREGLRTEFAMGVFKIPFGYEVLQSDADRPFIERSWGEQNMTPGEFDTGARMYTTYTHGKYRLDVQLAIVNGVTEGEPTFSLVPDLNKGKDFVGRMAADWGWGTLGVSGYYGQGQNVDATALRFKQFVRAAFNAEGALRFSLAKTKKEEWQTRILSELTLGQNMDRGVKYGFGVPAIPATITSDVKDLGERNVWVRIEQDFTRWFTLGLRWDDYTPDVSQSGDARDTFGAVGVVHFNKWLQAMLELDHAIDHVRPAGLAYTDKQIETGSGVLQARF